MLNIPLKWFHFTLALLGFISAGLSQNIVPNPSFETYTSCPPTFGAGGPLQATPWASATAGTSDYFNSCAPPVFVGIPQNYFGYQFAHTGNAYAGGFYRLQPFLYREYLLAPLLDTMETDSTYHVSLWVSLADHYCGTNQLGVYFSATPPPPGGSGPLGVVPQVVANIGYINNNTDWTLITGCYTAVGGEHWITIGNFSDDSATPIDPDCSGTTSSYYYVDDVSVVKGSPPSTLDLELGDPVTACTSYVIDPGIPDIYYIWGDGSYGSTLLVTQSGRYYLTITDGCSSGMDSLDVTINGIENVEIGPPEVTICSGDSYDISLDPGQGDYTWQDGSTSPDYSITTSGLYQVTLDDGCQLTTDEVMVTVLEPPAPFSLGPDAQLCDGDQIEFNLDPTLGAFLWQDGSASSSYSVTEPGTYALTISNMCGEYSDEVVVTRIVPPNVYLGPDQVYLCPGDIYEIELDPDMGDFLWQDGSDFNYYSITTPGTYSVTVTNPCGTTSQSIEVLTIAEPVVDLGPDKVLCPSQLPITLTVSGIPGVNYLWQDGSIDSVYAVTTGGTYSVTISNTCSSVSDSIQILVVDNSPTVVLPPDQMLCQGQTLTLDGGGVAGNYHWQDGSTGQTYTVNTPGTYALTITNQCGSGADSVYVDYMADLLPPDLGPDLSLCPGETLVLHTQVTGVNYTWQNMSSADSLLVNGPGVYWLQIANMCSDATDTIVVSLNNNPPVVDLPASIDLCSGDSVVIDAGISGVQFLWNDDSQSSTLKVKNPGVYSLTVSNTCGSDVDSVVVNDAGAAPLVSLGQDISFCSGDMNLITPVSSGVNSWLWQDGTTSSTYLVSSPGLYTVQVANNCGVSYDTLIASLLSTIPVLQLGPDTSLCPGQSFTLSINTPGVSILWSDGSVGSDFNVTGPSQVYASITNVCGSSSDSVDVTSLPAVPSLNLGSDQSLCPGDVITLSPGISSVNYLWQDGSTAPSFNATQQGTIILTISNACGAATDTIQIIENSNGPQVSLGPDVKACAGSVVTLSSGISGVNYLWQDGSTSPDYATSVSGTFILTVSNSCGTDVDTVEVEINGTAPEINLGKDTMLCNGQSILLSAGTDSLTNLVWQDGSNAATYTVINPGSYILSASNPCGNASDTINVAYQSAPVDFNLGSDTILCPGESILLNAPLTNNIITWQDGSHGATMLADQAILYSLHVSNICGTKADSLVLDFDQRNPSITIDSTLHWCDGDVITLDATQPFSADYLWNDGSVSSSIQVSTPGSYSVSVITDCQSAQMEINVVPGNDCNHNVYVPTIFSPNGDQVNDVFSISTGSNLEVNSLSCSIFDRWGNLVYNTHEINFAWDGRFNNSTLMPGVYVYVINLEYIFQGIKRTQILSGDITLVR